MKHLLYLPLAGLMLLAALPSSSNYQIHNYGYGSGGTNNSTSTNYGLNGSTGEVSNQESTSTNYKARSGTENAQQAHVPTITLSNPSNYYNRLQLVINPGANPSDTLFSIAISTDNFTTTQYIQSDNTIASTRPLSAYQTYSAWGGASGALVLGLQPSTTYYVKVNAFQGKYTETEYGPVGSAATVAPNISFDIDVSPTDTNTNPPYTTTIGSLLPATVVTDNDLVWVSFATNAVAGGYVYVRSANGGLKSNTTSTTITSASADLAGASTGFGLQVASATQSSGGPLTSISPFNGSAQNVGAVATTATPIFSSGAPITAGRGSVYLKAKASAQTPAGNDYGDALTLTAVGAF